ncbi:MAG TPA: hypothetical protein VNB86_01360 [Gaiellaceae bacterium]|jgi:hypothetical protein|nr:hypothetical protein [Gaiellaceae bacterium]
MQPVLPRRRRPLLRLSRRAWTALSAILAGGAVCLAAACGGDDKSTASGGCRPESRSELQALFSDHQRGEVERGEGAVAVAYRDRTATLVGVCQPTPALPRSLPTLQAGGRSYRAAGGSLVKTPSGWINYLLYPPTAPSNVAVVRGGTAFAQLRFGEPTAESCARRTGALRLLGCGALAVVEWNTPLRLRAKDVLVLDVITGDGSALGRPLGFYLYGLSNADGRLRARFGLVRPKSGRAGLWLRSVTTRAGERRLSGVGYRVRLAIPRR